MFEWYDLRMIDLYPDDEAVNIGPTAPQGIIGEPREKVTEGEEGLSPEEIRVTLARSGEHSSGD